MQASTATVLAMISAAWVSYAYPTFAQDATTPLPPEILACAGENDVMLRLSCYDREVAAHRSKAVAPPPAVTNEAPVSAATSPSPNVAPSPVAAVVVAESLPAETAVTPTRSANSPDNFGFDAPADEITSNVTRIRERPYGELIVYLENGQVWEQKHRDRRFRLKTGESVTISKSAVAGYRLSGNSNRSIQVERLK